VTPEEYLSVREYFHHAVDQDSAGRARTLESIPSSTVREEVERLLRLSDEKETFLDEPLFQEPQSLMPGEVIGRFRVTRELARGGMGAVFEAEDLKFSKKCAIKTIAPEWLDDTETVSRFERETRIGRELNHANICRVYEYLEERRGRHLVGMVVMEFIDGRTIDELVKQDGPVPKARAAEILTGILDGLEAAHSAGVIHRDLKPSNVMIQDSGRIVLLDFGLARHAAETSQTQRIRGTLGYMAPEQHRGESTFRSDIYSLGLLIHFMLTARDVGGGERVPRAWREPLRRCTAVAAEERYASIAEVRAAFFPRFVWTRRAWIGAAAAAAAVLWETRRAGLEVAAGTPLVLEAVENRTGDAMLDALAPVVSAQLEQSPRIRLMETSADASGKGLGLRVTLLAEKGSTRLRFLLRSLSGKRSEEHEVTAESRANLLPAIHEGCLWVRRTIGESAQDIAELDVRPEAATTRSWEALLAFTRAERESRDRNAEAALIALDEALRQDPKFALASMRKGDILSSLGRDGDALNAWKQTLQMAADHRLSRLEDFRIRSMFAGDTWDFAGAIKIYDTYVTYYPHDADAWHYRAIPLIMLGRGEEAMETMRKCLAIEPGDGIARAGAGLFAAIVGHSGAAHDYLSAAGKRRPTVAARLSQMVAFIEGRYSEVDDWFERALWRTRPEQQSAVRNQYAHILAELGKWEAGQRILREGIEIDLKSGLMGNADQKRMALLTVNLRLNKQVGDAGLQPLVDRLRESSGPWIRVQGASALARAGEVSLARALAEGIDGSSTTPLFDYASQRARGEILMVEGREKAGLTLLERAARVLPPAWPREFLAWAYANAGRREATEEYKKVVAAKGMYWLSVNLERPGIWADSLERLTVIDSLSCATMTPTLRAVRRTGEK
jgi:tetratricopeptide (TPR) repeat protein/tRNA A-37 threonylcarbamoyl transferase component Bud32